MKGDIAFAGFVLTAAEWQELDPESRAQLIAVATRKEDPWLAVEVYEPQSPMAEGSGPFENVEFLELELDPDDAAESLTRE